MLNDAKIEATNGEVTRGPSGPLLHMTATYDFPATTCGYEIDPAIRDRWQRILVEISRNNNVGLVVDIGSGEGHDLHALRDAGVNAVGVEPNDYLRDRSIVADGLTMYRDVADAPIEEADILNIIDVLEYTPNPDAWLGGIASRGKIGAILLETSAVWEAPALRENRGWAPGRVLQSHGWDRIATAERMSAWQRFEAGPINQTYIVVCTSTSLSIKTHQSILGLLRSDQDGTYNWVPSESTEAGLLRARSGWASKWYRDTCGDGFLMIDSDIGFKPQDAMHIAQVGREKQSIVVGAYPTKDGKNLTIRPLEDFGELSFGPDEPPRPIRWGPTGYMWVPRVVLDAVIPTIPLCGAHLPHSMWPIFNLDFTRDPLPDGSDGWQLLGEDFTLCERALNLGFTIWLDPTIEVDHWSGLIPVNIRNMQAVAALVREDA